MKFTKSILSCLFVLLIFSCVIIYIKNIYVQRRQNELEINVEKELQEIKFSTTLQEKTFPNGEIGLIIIPSIDLKAPIKEGTSSDILKYWVGHFIETNIWDGNVVLASHNRGSYAHYFSRINELENGEEIIYITNMGERRYKVTENRIIEETNVNILKNTEENIITLITCITNKRDKRQCIIGIEIK